MDNEDMKRELLGIKSRLGHVESRLGDVESRLERVEATAHHVAINVAALTGKVSALEQTMAKAGLDSLRSDLLAKMDGFVRLADQARLSWAVHTDRLNSHDKRLKKLEARHS